MRISFIGMSNIGKSYWTKRLAVDHGYTRIDCDALIEQNLSTELTKTGQHGLRGVAKWMGLPADPDYKRNSGLYVAAEREAMRQALDNLPSDDHRPLVIDTTGSVIYSGADILGNLRAATRVIYLEASETHIEAMFKRYIAHPKPTIWDNDYAPQAGEAQKQTLKRCYPVLLRNRAQRYKEIAHVTIPFEKHKDHGADIFNVVQEYISKS